MTRFVPYTISMTETAISIQKAVTEFARHIDNKDSISAAVELARISTLGKQVSDTAYFAIRLLPEPEGWS
jgi:hypothetical protein